MYASDLVRNLRGGLESVRSAAVYFRGRSAQLTSKFVLERMADTTSPVLCKINDLERGKTSHGNVHKPLLVS